MNLYIDVGNTATKFAVDNKNLVAVIATFDTIKIIKEVEATLKDLDLSKIDNAYISSVVPKVNNILVDYLNKLNIKSSFINSDDESGVKILIDNKKELGSDLLCDLAGAKDLYRYPLLIIDLGTATKFLFIDIKGTFYTCMIVQGLEMALKNLSNNTALLPELSFSSVKPLLDNKNTKDVLVSSAYYSQIDTINGMVKRYRASVNYPFRVVVTGGNIDLVKKDFDFKYEVVNNLCLYGIKVIINNRK